MMVTGQGVEEKGGETANRVARLDEAEKEKGEGNMPPYILTGEIRTENETAGTAWTEQKDSDLEIEVEHKCRQKIDGKEIAQERISLQHNHTRRNWIVQWAKS